MMELNAKIRNLLQEGEILEIERELEQAVNLNAELKIIKTLVKVFKVEIQNNVEDSVFDYSVDYDTLLGHYKKIKALLRRIEFDLLLEQTEELYFYCVETRVSQFLLGVILLSSVYHRKKVCRAVIEMWNEKGNEYTAFINYMKSVEKYLEGQRDE